MRRSAFVLILAAALANASAALADDKPIPWTEAETRVGQPAVAVGLEFSSGVACMTMLLVIVTLLAPLTE